MLKSKTSLKHNTYIVTFLLYFYTKLDDGHFGPKHVAYW
jgi:hypothetical protein